MVLKHLTYFFPSRPSVKIFPRKELFAEGGDDGPGLKKETEFFLGTTCRVRISQLR